MRIRIPLVASLLISGTPGMASEGVNPIFGFTHLLASPFTLPAGRLVLGTEIAIGLTDFLQIGTNVLRDAYQVYNANAKVSLVDTDLFALALTGQYQSYNYSNIDPSNPDIAVSSWQPGMVMGYSPLPNVAHFVGGRLSYSSVTQNVAGTQLSGYVQGAELETDLSWAHAPGKRPTALVLSLGVSYDFTYKLAGYGVSYHLPGLHFGLHYYPNADKYKVQPIIMGGTSISL